MLNGGLFPPCHAAPAIGTGRAIAGTLGDRRFLGFGQMIAVRAPLEVEALISLLEAAKV